jgi:hypothetical protein
LRNALATIIKCGEIYLACRITALGGGEIPLKGLGRVAATLKNA